MKKCILCNEDAGEVLVRAENWRIVLVEDALYPGFCRVIWQDHVKEMTDLTLQERNEFMRIVFEVEFCVRETLQPDKINLATLGNMTPHLHWHIIPRFNDDSTFPDAIWSAKRRETSAEILDGRRAKLDDLRGLLRKI